MPSKENGRKWTLTTKPSHNAVNLPDDGREKLNYKSFTWVFLL